ncbi:MAG: hypothetical protein KDE27_07050 [Planctomycetes bacterium]|nr:hypothetical protein [Planctomycetota bacterium]
MKTARSLIHAWLVLDFFGDARRRGGTSSTLTTTIFTQAFLALVFAALLYPETPVVPFAAANLSLSSLLIAVSILGDADRVDRRRADQVLVGTSPAGRWSVLLAHAGHAAFYVGLLTIGMALPPAILLGFLQQSATSAVAYIALACLCSGLATGALAVALGLLARLFGPARAVLIGGSLKALLLGAGIALFALGLQNLRGSAADLPIGRLGAELLAPYHAARLLRDPATESWRLGALLGAGVVLALLAALRRDVEGASGARRRDSGPLRWLLLKLCRRGPAAGIAEFTATQMWRSPGFRARVLPLLGLPAVMIYVSLRDTADAGDRGHAFVFLCVLLQLPAIYLPFLIAFLPRADQQNARWVFDQAPPVELGVVRDAVWRALVTHVLLPVHAVAATLLIATSRDPLEVALGAVFALGTAIVAAKPMTASLRTVPFTDDAAGEPANDLGALFSLALPLLGLAILFGYVFSPAIRLLAAALAVLAAVLLLRRQPTGAASEAAATATRSAVEDEPQVTEANKATSPEQEAASSLGRELRAVGLLYAAVSVVPILVGALFAD